MSQETMEREFAVTAPARLTVSNIRGAVDVQPGDDGLVKVTAVKYSNTGDADWTEIDIQQEADGRVVAKTRFEKEGRKPRGRRRPCRVHYTVYVPPTCDVKVRCVSSKMSVRGVEGQLDLKTVSGTIVLKDLSGELRATAVSGDIIGERLGGAATFDSVSGNVRVLDSHFPVVKGSSVSGDVVLQTPLSEGPYGFETVSGNVELTLPSEAGCTIRVRSMSGRFKTSLPITKRQAKHTKFSADLQGGGPLVRFSSVSGNLSVTSAP